ncbi:MAG: PilT/PilU family type 4a pilus ATPase, partial [Lentisphaeraceae bacterium]|nr:PilT/PilU family type 4a pilus ATPase [Lentisphaeraceae bacterium]
MKQSATLQELLELSINMGISDLHLSVDSPPIGRIDGILTRYEQAPWSEEHMLKMLDDCLNDEEKQDLRRHKSLDCACSHSGARFRINIYMEKGYPAWAIRRLESKLKTVEELHLPLELLELTSLKDGLVLFTGPTGSGKSTSLATLINHINCNRSCHILTIEDPIEYLHSNKKSLVHQRELGSDVTSFSNSLREALREDPDVILVGEMRDLDTIRAALTAAETGHLVFSTLHCADTVGALDRILAMYPGEEQDSIRRQLGMS